MRTPMGSVPVALFLLALVVAGCSTGVRRELWEPAEFGQLDREAETLKAHMRDGRVAVLESWRVDSNDNTLRGEGWWLDVDRNVTDEGRITVAVDSVALFETNSRFVTDGSIGFAALTVLSGVVTVACLLNPKSCFGSCPTFYIDGYIEGERIDRGDPDDHDEQNWQLVAEGFSSSVAPSLEATDVDALGVLHTDEILTLRVTNEAYETHAIRHADLLSFEVSEGERVGRIDDGRFRRARGLIGPAVARGSEGDCREWVARRDGEERSSLASESDLAERETVDLVFAVAPEARGRELGLFVNHRQSLMSTWLFYQGLAYLGSTATTWLAKLERGELTAQENISAVGRRLGGIEVQRRDDDGHWRSVAELHETGPLAIDGDLVELAATEDDSLRLRLRMTRGLWRIDALRLAVLGDEVEPTRHRPVLARRENGDRPDPEALAALLDSSRTLVTLPGDELRLDYAFDGSAPREVFLESRGWYLEWMREEWMKEENPWMAAQLFLAPDQALRQLAPQYKRVEAEMEPIFWGSRYAQP